MLQLELNFFLIIGNGKYGIYLANYAAYGSDGPVGAHTILEMDENRSYGNEIYLKNIGEEVGVKRFTGESFRKLSCCYAFSSGWAG